MICWIVLCWVDVSALVFAARRTASARWAFAGICRIATAPARAAAPYSLFSLLTLAMSMSLALVRVSNVRFAVQHACVAIELGHVLQQLNAGVFPACALGEALVAFEFLQPAADRRLRTADERSQPCL